MAQGQAQLFGGEGHGRTVQVDLVAGRYYPVYLGFEGSNYVFDQSWEADPAYMWWPPGADEPVNRWE